MILEARKITKNFFLFKLFRKRYDLKLTICFMDRQMLKKILMAILFLGVSISTVFLLSHIASHTHSFKIQPSPVIEVVAVPIERKTNTETLMAMGTAMTSDTQKITADAKEQVLELFFSEGEEITEGEQIAMVQCPSNKKVIIKSPLDGVTALCKVQEGDFLNQGDEIVTLKDIEPIRIDFTIPKNLRRQVYENQVFSAMTITYPNKIFWGKITTIHPRVDEVTRALTISGHLNNEKHQIKPGMMFKLSLLLSTTQVLTIPREALQSFGNKKYVFILDHQREKAVKKNVKVISETKNKAYIQASIPDDAKVITIGANQLNHGQKIKIKQLSSQSRSLNSF